MIFIAQHQDAGNGVYEDQGANLETGRDGLAGLQLLAIVEGHGQTPSQTENVGAQTGGNTTDDHKGLGGLGQAGQLGSGLRVAGLDAVGLLGSRVDGLLGSRINGLSDRLSNRLSDRLSDGLSDGLSNRLSDGLSDGLSNRLSGRAAAGAESNIVLKLDAAILTELHK